MITGTPLDEAQQQAAKADYGADDFLFKPFTGIDLQKLLERAFARNRMKGSSGTAPWGFYPAAVTAPFYMEKVTGCSNSNVARQKNHLYQGRLSDFCPFQYAQ